MADEQNPPATPAQNDGGKAPPAEPPKTEGEDNIDGLKRHNKALLSELSTKKAAFSEVKEKYDALVAEKEQREADELKKQGQYKELMEKEQAKAAAIQNRLIRAEMKAHAIRAGVIDMDLVDLIPVDKVKIGDSLEISGAEEAIAAFKSSKPHLFNDAPKDPGAQNPPQAKPTGAAVTDPKPASPTTSLANSVKPGSKEHLEARENFMRKFQ